jgi:hypothetical protein
MESIPFDPTSPDLETMPFVNLQVFRATIKPLKKCDVSVYDKNIRNTCVH